MIFRICSQLCIFNGLDVPAFRITDRTAESRSVVGNFMPPISNLPLRQKVFLSITVLTGLFILLAYHINFLSWETLNLVIFFYGVGVPMLLLTQDTLVDLDKPDIFKIWVTIAVLFLIAYFLTKDNPSLTVRRSPDFVDRGINKLISKGSTTALKALPLFLLCYWPLNYIVKKRTGNFIINTFRQFNWQHDIANREIDWYDVMINLFLAAVIIFAGLFEI